jgi:hypothetical protein
VLPDPVMIGTEKKRSTIPTENLKNTGNERRES